MSEAQELIRVTDGHVVAGTELLLAIESLRERASNLAPIQDQHTYAEAMEIVAKGKQEIKAVEVLAEPELAALRNRANELRGQRDKITGQITDIIGPIEKQAREWNLREREAAAAEQAKLNKGKRAEDRVHVEPSIPTVPGVQVRAKYRFEVVDISKMKREFLCPDEVKINAKLREEKNPEKSAKEIGGIRAWRE